MLAHCIAVRWVFITKWQNPIHEAKHTLLQPYNWTCHILLESSADADPGSCSTCCLFFYAVSEHGLLCLLWVCMRCLRASGHALISSHVRQADLTLASVQRI
jgi:hypothetical protein